MANLRILYDNLWSRTTSVVTASSAVAGLPAAATQTPQRTYVWRSALSTGTKTLDIDMGAQLPGVLSATCVAVANARLHTSSVITLSQRGNGSTPSSATLVATLPAPDPHTRVAMAFFSAQDYRHWQLTFTNLASENSYVELGYAFLGTYWEASVNFATPADIAFSDPSAATTSLDGQKDFNARTGVHTAALRFLKIAEAQRAAMRDIYRAVGVRTPVFVALDPALTWTHWLARFAAPISQPFDLAPARYDLAVSVEEAR